MLLFVGTSSNTFSMFTWLPRVLVSYGFTEHQAGLMLAYYAILGALAALWIAGVVWVEDGVALAREGRLDPARTASVTSCSPSRISTSTSSTSSTS